MSPSLQALLTGLIDYAGLFPPAKLPLAEALERYQHDRVGKDSWMLGRFVCPTARLGELIELLDRLAPNTPVSISALGRGGNTESEFLQGLQADLREITQVTSTRIVVDVLEAKYPQETLVPSYDLMPFLQRIRDVLGTAKQAIFFEVSPKAVLLQTLFAGLREVSWSSSVGYKLRCGGLEPTAFPTSEAVAVSLNECIQAGIPFKATAGLHHPLPRRDERIPTRMHGFINLFLAGVMLHTGVMGPDQAVELLNDDRPDNFRFESSSCSWRDRAVSLSDIERVRRTVMMSFGSCSFDEPRDDLRELGWMVSPPGEQS